MLLWVGWLKCMTTFRTCIRLRAGFIVKRFRPHTVYVLLHRVKPSDWSCAAPIKYIDRLDSALFCVVGCVMKKQTNKKNNKKSYLFKFRKRYIHIDNNVKFKMYKSSKSLQSEKVIVFALHTLAKKNRNQHL